MEMELASVAQSSGGAMRMARMRVQRLGDFV